MARSTERMATHLATASKMDSEMGIILALSNTKFLENERMLHRTADAIGLTSCQHCGYCCLRRPCVPSPSEMPVIASYLGLSPSELAEQHMVVDIYKANYYLLWAGETQLDLTGKLLLDCRTYDRGYCHFFNRESHTCRIYPIRPKSSTITACWNKRNKGNTEDYRDEEYEARDEWNIELVRQFLPNFVGEDEDV